MLNLINEQSWQCATGKEVAWNLLSLLTTSGLLCLEISLVGFLLQESYASGLEALARTFTISGIIAGIDMLLKVTSQDQLIMLKCGIIIHGMAIEGAGIEC